MVDMITLGDMNEKERRQTLMDMYGVKYWDAGESDVYTSPPEHAYFFQTYIGDHALAVEAGDSAWIMTGEGDTPTHVRVKSGPALIESRWMCTVIRGYQPSERIVELAGCAVLPYVNGCSTKQLIAPPRHGDPTFQYLHIPPFSKEQAHHIHSTVRAVYILSGKGVSVVGMHEATVEQELLPGTVCILEPMCPHHFETPQGESLVVIPLHVFSATPLESNHPMFNGTFLMNQGD